MKNNISNTKQKTALRPATNDFLNEFTWNYFITLNFTNLKTEKTAHKILNTFIKNLNIYIFGRKSKKAVRIVIALEKHKNGCLHCHILTDDPINRIENPDRKLKLNYKEAIRECWQGADKLTANINLSCPDKSSWFKVIFDQQGVIDYITKEINRGHTDVIQWDLINPTGYRIK